MRRHVEHWAAILAFASFCLAVSTCVQGCSGHHVADAAKRASNVVDEKAYADELDACIAAGKDAGSLDVYETCAKRSDAEHGRKP